MNKFDRALFGIDHDKRKEIHHRLNLEEVEVLKASENAEWVAEDFDRIFMKLLRMIRYTLDKNGEEQDKLQQYTRNMIEKFLNYVKYKFAVKKWEIMQKYYFKDICGFINFFDGDPYNSAVHNNIPKTSLQEYSEKTVWNQFFQNVYARNRWIDGICEWWSCSYWTVLLYNFFNKLKEAWLDLKISFFRYKNLDDEISWFPTQRHSWLIVNFQWEDYMVDRDGVLYDKTKPIVRPLQPYIDISQKRNESDAIELFENFKYENRKDTDKVIFFDDLGSFLQHCEKYPEHYRVSFYAKFPDKDTVENVSFEFWEHSFMLWLVEYYLRDNDLPMNNLTKNIIKKAYVKRIWGTFEAVTDEDREYLKKYFDLIKNKVDLNKLHENFTSDGRRKSELLNFNWESRVAIMLR